ncbi:hypothetical protein [Hydrogenophaga sp. BPS33]|uniref:hypothetical protein n=1 Tax=Hydrogenophaga sp. BPS33 TaxID=2651974 RepID=UPI00131FB98B|nr:hypothetical protein [Hydrogenophaga sp. BPS33]QHE84427.1 hypothetical protein F9K07_05760 [Hydrogenophaga sp. BPS33]
MAVSGSGPKRPNPYALEAQPDSKIARNDDSESEDVSESGETPMQKAIRQELTPFLRRKDLALNAPEYEDLMNLWTSMAEGSVTALEPDDAKDVFNDLLGAHEYPLLVATFNRYHHLLEAASLGNLDAPPHRRSLELCLPTDWKPDLPELTQALNQMNVDCVRVRPRYPQDPVGLATCLCVATLLNSGASELHLQGHLSAIQPIVSAIPVSALRTIALSQAPLIGPPTEAEITGHRRILKALAHCPTLEHLHLGYSELLDMHAIVGNYATQGGPQLKAITLGYH